MCGAGRWRHGLIWPWVTAGRAGGSPAKSSGFRRALPAKAAAAAARRSDGNTGCRVQRLASSCKHGQKRVLVQYDIKTEVTNRLKGSTHTGWLVAKDRLKHTHTPGGNRTPDALGGLISHDGNCTC